MRRTSTATKKTTPTTPSRPESTFDQPPVSQPELNGPPAASDTYSSETYPPYETSPSMSVGIGSPGSPAGGTPSLAQTGVSHTLPMTLGGLAAVLLGGGMLVLDRLRGRRSGQHS